MTMILDGTNGETFPSWTTGTRPASPTAGQTGYNSTITALETYNGTAWTSGGGGFTNYVVLTSGTSYTFPSFITKAKVTIFGGGGGGGRGTTNNNSNGGGGGAGGAGIAFMTFSAGASATYSIGAGGAGSASITNSSDTTGGSAGGTTTFTVGGVTVTATGGGGGGSTAASALNQFYTLMGTAGTTTNTSITLYPNNYVLFVSSASISNFILNFIPSYGQMPSTFGGGNGTFNATTALGFGTGGGSGGNGSNSTSLPTGSGGTGGTGAIILEF
jgi:hypothetical protein